MENLFITNIKVNKVRHLKDFEIDLSEQKAKHLILTGKNGCGKTSLLDAMATFLDSILGLNDLASKIQSLKNNKEILQRYQKEHRADNEIKEEQKIVELQSQLNETDYKIIKCNEYSLAGLELPYDIETLHKERQAIRDKINQLQGE